MNTKDKIMTRTFTCIVCPNGCEVTVKYKEAADAGNAPEILSVEGNTCPRGEAYVKQELTDPRRTIASSVLVKGGVLPLASVRITAPVPKKRIFDVMEEIRKITVTAPVQAGTVLVKDLLGLGTDLIITKTVDKA